MVSVWIQCCTRKNEQTTGSSHQVSFDNQTVTKYSRAINYDKTNNHMLRTFFPKMNTSLYWFHVGLQPCCLYIHQLLTQTQAHRVRTDIKTLFSRTFQDLQRPNSRIFQDSKNVFSSTFQDTLRSQTWLHEVKKCTDQISFRCNCITVNKPKWNTCGCINIL